MSQEIVAECPDCYINCKSEPFRFLVEYLCSCSQDQYSLCCAN